MPKNYSHPDLNDANLQSNIYHKENFIIIKYQKGQNLKIKKILKNIEMIFVKVK